ncbi:MAG: hypothetical protein HGA16_00900 [Candidatus Moranbacteria bacterium]|nr:hypothetical protein [Candidatus Moranbacteria bacterium]
MSEVFHVKRRQIGALYRLCALFVFVFPASANYQLQGYGFGSGGEENATSANYALDAMTGETGASNLVGANYSLGAGLSFAQQADVPAAPTITNPSNYYNKLHLVINTSGNASDALFAIAISTDGFATTNYVKSDHTVGATLTLSDYQTYAAWGGATGIDVIGLTANTTYQVKAKAMHGKFTETGYGPTASAATVNPTLSFGITTDTQSSPPFSVDFGVMVPGSVNTSPHQVNVTMNTNGANGGQVYVSGANAGLRSAGVSYTIAAVSGNLSSLSEGFGAQGISATQTSGGPFTIATLYNQGSDIVGITDTNVRTIFTSAGPVVGAAGSFNFKAKPSSIAPAASDYSETLTIVAAGSF